MPVGGGRWAPLGGIGIGFGGARRVWKRSKCCAHSRGGEVRGEGVIDFPPPLGDSGADSGVRAWRGLTGDGDGRPWGERDVTEHEVTWPLLSSRSRVVVGPCGFVA